jgi:DNA-binding MarR family transcriptional regulator
VAQGNGVSFEEAIQLLYFAHREVVAEPDQLLARRRLGRVHHRILYCIARQPGITVGSLCRVLRISKQALHGPLAAIERAGLVVRRVSETNRRERQLKLTPRGMALEARLAESQRKRFDQAFREAGPTATAGWRAVMLRLWKRSEAAEP